MRSRPSCGVLDVNLTGHLPHLHGVSHRARQAKGAIVNIASMNATLALPRIPAYCASKGGVVMLTKALALSWAEEGIRVNAVAPGYIETTINAAGRSDLAHHQRIADRTAFKRWGQPEDVAGAVVFSLHAGVAICDGARWSRSTAAFLAG